MKFLFNFFIFKNVGLSFSHDGLFLLATSSSGQAMHVNSISGETLLTMKIVDELEAINGSVYSRRYC